jgi:hypothetical protein
VESARDEDGEALAVDDAECPTSLGGSRLSLVEPALVEAADERLNEADRVGEGPVLDVLRDVGRPVIVGRLLELRARAQRRALVAGGERVSRRVANSTSANSTFGCVNMIVLTV